MIVEFWREIGSLVALGVSAVLVIISRIPKQTIEQQKDLIQALTGRIEDLEKSHENDVKNHLESVKAIANLQGKIDVYKEIPLKDIADSMKQMSKVNSEIAKSNDLILRTLQKSAKTLATENQTVQEQTVIHQTVEETV